MQELRFVRRDNQTVIVADETDTEYRLVLDDALLSELRHLQRQHSTAPRLNPRVIQTMLREGRTLKEVAQKVGANPEDIERYAEPVFAERRFILDRAGAVPVRTEQAEAGTTETFREVIDQRLRSVLATEIEWTAYRDAEGWHISLDFSSRDAKHHAEWHYDHKKNVLVAANTDAINLSQQGDVGDRLIPRLRPVEAVPQPPVAQAPAEDKPAAAETPQTETAEATEPATAQVPAAPETDSEEEYKRKQEVAHWAVKTADEPQDFSQTADLLDALRKRRGERENNPADESLQEAADTLLLPEVPQQTPASVPGTEVQDEARLEFDEVETATAHKPALHAVPRPPADNETTAPEPPNAAAETAEQAEKSEKSRSKKGRASIPKWEDILFGTRSDEDPA